MASNEAVAGKATKKEMGRLGNPALSDFYKIIPVISYYQLVQKNTAFGFLNKFFLRVSFALEIRNYHQFSPNLSEERVVLP